MDADARAHLSILESVYLDTPWQDYYSLKGGWEPCFPCLPGDIHNLFRARRPRALVKSGRWRMRKGGQQAGWVSRQASREALCATSCMRAGDD